MKDKNNHHVDKYKIWYLTKQKAVYLRLYGKHMTCHTLHISHESIESNRFSTFGSGSWGSGFLEAVEKFDTLLTQNVFISLLVLKLKTQKKEERIQTKTQWIIHMTACCQLLRLLATPPFTIHPEIWVIFGWQIIIFCLCMRQGEIVRNAKVAAQLIALREPHSWVI